MDRNVVRMPDSSPTALCGERRRSVRQKLHSPVYVSFNGPLSGMVVDLSELLDLHENGFAVQTAIPTGVLGKEHLEVNHAVTLCLELPETRKYLHGSGQVMWTDNTGRAGIRFSFLPEGSRQILKEWLFANLLVASTNHAARVEQVAHHQKEKAEPPLRDVSTRDVRVPDSSAPEKSLPQDLSVADKLPAQTQTIPVPVSGLTSAAPPERDELLSALDDVQREVREIEARTSEAGEPGAPGDLDPILQFITRCALSLTGATGAALALRHGDKTLCRARAGAPAPPVGSEVDVRAGLSGECVRHGIPVACEDPENDSRVDPEVCRRLGIGSFVAAPIFTGSRVVGLLEIFSPAPRHFTRIHGTILQRLTELVPRVEENVIEANVIEAKKIEAKETAVRTTEEQTVLVPTLAAKTIEPAESEQKKTALRNPGQNATEREIEHQASRGQSTPPPMNSLEAPARKLKEMPPGARTIEPKAIAPIAEYESPKLQNKGAASPLATPRRLYILQITLLLLVLGTVAMVLGYLLAPTIQKRWMGQPKLAQNSRPTSQQASSTSSVGSSYPLQNTSGQRDRVLSPDDLRKLAGQGDPDAQYELGILYHEGSVVPKDDAQAVQWFQRAAEQGYVRAQSTLGAYYWAGRGVPQDLMKAYFWSQLALAQGDENSKSRLEGLSAQMTQSQVANARQQAEAWLRAHTQSTKPNPGAK
ncbi:MAG: GAF domain-containing protein [Terriglobales bacterium]